jgi:hypothetical protein
MEDWGIVMLKDHLENVGMTVEEFSGLSDEGVTQSNSKDI